VVEKIARGHWGMRKMLKYLAYALFVALIIGCFGYVMRSLETEEAPPDQKQ
jgi:hypothetical protein